MSETAPASEIHPDVLELAQKICDEAAELVEGVETLDANNWLDHADKIDALNSQLQHLIIPAPEKETKSAKSTKEVEPTEEAESAKSTKSQTTSKKDSEGVN